MTSRFRVASSLALASLAACDLGIQVGRGSGATTGRELSLGSQSSWTPVIPSDPNPCELDLDFGSVPVGYPDTAYVEVENMGTSPLPLSVDGTLDPAFTVLNDTEQPIPANGTGQLAVTFQPRDAGTVTSSFTLPTKSENPSCPAVDGTSDSVLTVKLTGTGFAFSCVTVQPNPLDFGNVNVNTVAKQSVTLINKCSVAATGLMASMAGNDANLFTVDNGPITLGAADSATVDISYAPLATETRSQATVVFSGSDGEKASLTLYGEPLGTVLTLAPDPINFGYAPLRMAAVGCTTVTNQANVPVSITGTEAFATDDGAFGLASTDDATPPNPFSLPIAIQAGASAKVCFSFTPIIPQNYTGQVTLVTDDPRGAAPTLELTGWGGGPQITCSPPSVAFGHVAEGKRLSVAVLCTNSGTVIPGSNLLLGAPTASPAVFSAQFDATTDPYPLNGLGPGQSAQIDVIYAPTSSEPTGSVDKGTLSIKNNGGQGAAVQIPLTGQRTN